MYPIRGTYSFMVIGTWDVIEDRDSLLWWSLRSCISKSQYLAVDAKYPGPMKFIVILTSNSRNSPFTTCKAIVGCIYCTDFALEKERNRDLVQFINEMAFSWQRVRNNPLSTTAKFHFNVGPLYSLRDSGQYNTFLISILKELRSFGNLAALKLPKSQRRL